MTAKNKMELYHGSYMEIPLPAIKTGRFTKDFGDGFYCTELKLQAERWAKRYDTPIVNVYEYEFHAGLKILNFEELTDEWLGFIVACRSGEPHNYDIVARAMAETKYTITWQAS